MMNDLILNYQKRLNQILVEILDATPIPSGRIREAMHYTLFPGGKRIRPLLVYLCGEVVDVGKDILDIISASVELTHNYSLIHDDLPAMDNDDFRRNLPSCHRAFDEATAILVGDGMQALAMEVLLSRLPHYLSTAETVLIAHELIRATGPSGMISGQSLDLSELSKSTIDLGQIKEIHHLKTGHLIKSCINMVIHAASLDAKTTKILQECATILGLVFQMQDDFLDRYQQDLMGKHRASDLSNQKTTFADLYSYEDLDHEINVYYEQAKFMLTGFADKSKNFIEFISHLQNRSNLKIMQV